MSQTNTIGRLTRAIQVIPSDAHEVPHPAYEVISSTTTTSARARLIDNTVNFETMFDNYEFSIGDIIYDTTNADSAIIEEIESPTVLVVSGTGIASGANYTIYRAGKNNGCILILPIMSKIRVTTVGASDLLGSPTSLKFTASPGSQKLFPLQVTKVHNRDTSVTSGQIVACFY